MNPHNRNGHKILSLACLPFHHPGGLGAKDGTRTRDPNLGKVMLYQLSYFRKCDCKYSACFLFMQKNVAVFMQIFLRRIRLFSRV